MRERDTNAREKREELKTYRDLALRRELKSKAQRRRVEADGKRRVLGDGSTSQPYLVVETRHYRDVRLAIQKKLLLDARAAGITLSADILLRQLEPRLDALVYAKLADESSHASLCRGPVAALGRGLTTMERRQFAAAAASARKPNDVARTALNHVLGAIEQRQTHNPARHQTVWAQLVGPEAAQQSQLDQVDPQTQTAYFRCYNSVLSADLQRRKGLAQQLAKALNLPIRQLRARF